MTVASPRHRELGLTDREYELIVEHMEREPNEVELAVFSLMWSEHCAYKHSKQLLRTLPTEGARVVMGPGENAGAVSLGGGLACAFKVESHNHPSAVEPFQGAATGVGGILRDVFAVGARPIAILDSLRFGEVGAQPALALPARAGGRRHRPLRQLDRRRHRGGRDLLRGRLRAELPRQRDVPRADPGGRPDPLGGGGRRQRRAAVRRAHGPRRDRRRVGAGLAPSSTSSTPPSARRSRSATRSRRRSCSSARWSCSTAGCSSRCRTSARPGSRRRRPRWRRKGEVGIDIDVRKVPLREADMEAFEIMISESQERMLCVVEPDRVDEVVAVCEKWLVNATAIGEVTDDAAPARVRRRRAGRRHAGHRARRRVPGLRPRRRSRRACRCTRRRAACPICRPTRRASSLALLRQRQPRLAPLGVRAVRLPRRLAHRAPPRAGRRRGARAAGPAARSPSRSTATAAASPATPTAARSRPCSSARPTSPASAPSRSGSPTASTSATPRSRTSPGSSRARSPASPTPAARSRSPSSAATSRSTTRRAPARSSRRRSSGWSASCPRPTRSGRLGFAQEGDVVAVISAGSWAPAATGSELAKLRGEAPFGDLPARRPRRAAHAARRRPPGACARARCARPTTSPRAGSRSRSPSAASRAASARASTSRALRPAGEALLFGEGPGAFVVSGAGAVAARVRRRGGADRDGRRRRPRRSTAR